jgi:hypothetical protein
LALIAEVSVAFVGFSMVVGVLRPEQPEAAGRVQSMRAVAETGLIAGGGAILALTLNAFDLSHSWVWRISGLVVSLGWLGAFGYAMGRFRVAGERLRSFRRFVFMAPLVPVANALLLWNVVAPTGSAGARYVAALVVALAISAERFVSATFLSSSDRPAV